MENKIWKNTALLVMDVQQPIVNNLKEGEAFLKTLSEAIQKARDNSIPVIYVVVAFRHGYPEINPAGVMSSVLKRSPALRLDTEEAATVHPLVVPHDGDIIVIKKRVSAFAGSDLEIILRSMGIQHIVLAGIATSGVVLSTLREAADKDYRITVLSDCCADMDEEVHRVLTTKVFVKQAVVVTSTDWKIE